MGGIHDSTGQESCILTRENGDSTKKMKCSTNHGADVGILHPTNLHCQPTKMDRFRSPKWRNAVCQCLFHRLCADNKYKWDLGSSSCPWYFGTARDKTLPRRVPMEHQALPTLQEVAATLSGSKGVAGGIWPSFWEIDESPILTAYYVD
jgi:hypothetical protein